MAKTISITRRNEHTYGVSSDIPLSDGRFEQDEAMALVVTPDTTELQPIYRAGDIRVRSFRLRLGPVSAKAVRNLRIGDTATLVRS